MSSNPIDPEEELPILTDSAKEMLKDAGPLQIKEYGNLDPLTIEAMMVGYLVDIRDGSEPKTTDADKILNDNIRKEMFQDDSLKELFDEFIGFFRKNRRLISIEDISLNCINRGQTPQEASVYKLKAIQCRGAVMARSLDAGLIIEAMINRYLQKQQDAIYQKACRERADPKIGPQKSMANMREAIIRDLVDPRGGAVKAYDWQGDFDRHISDLLDMKAHPEKYRGYVCGIKAIDSKTQGFRKGQLTVFVGAHGGFKSTVLQNVAYGLWEAGKNVLIVSLEQEPSIVMLKMWCRATKISFSRAYNGGLTQKKDWEELKGLKEKLEAPDIPPDEKAKLTERCEKLRGAIAGMSPDNADYERLCEAKRIFESKPNRLKIINIGQSKKMKMSQLERWLQENVNLFKPDVVIVDYLDLVEAENPNPDRPDLDLGNICKMMRAMGENMGFSAITAAQLKRAALERLRKHGLDNPEKAQLDTDDISGSHQIGGDAENVFMLWRKEGGTAIDVFTAKSRYGMKDIDKGVTIQVDYETNTVSENIESLDRQISTKSMADGMSLISKNGPKKKTQMPGEDIDDLFSDSGDKTDMSSDSPSGIGDDF
jgi:replicative DNA helicase